MKHIVSLSGGKDSVALWLWARRTGLDPVAVYQDTGWEWDGHHRHLDLLEARIGAIRRIRASETFIELTEKKGTFPSRVRKWCTEELKLQPFRAWLEEFRDEFADDVTVMLGIRREESPKRAAMKEREWSDFYDCEVWRPILDWSVEQVIAEHRRAAIPMHPLYHHGAERVGCFPCVNASKAELELVGRLAPERVGLIASLEARIGQTMFTRDRRTEKLALIRSGVAKDDAGPSVEPIGIRDVMAWARTERGGKQIALVRAPSGCARWGVCEAPPLDDTEAA
jgi:3'-phosphoadenosine 5'-phosphosulfate sulfotransferase (PAPS reductase)/FAD synthetase